MNNYSTAQDYAKTATESSGTALEKFQAYEESVEAKTEALTAAVEGLVNNFTSSDFMKFLLDMGKGLVNAADSAHLLQIALGALGVKATLSGFSKLGSFVDKLNAQLLTYNKSMALLHTANTKQIHTISALELALNKQGLSLSNLTKEQMIQILVENKEQLELQELTRDRLAEIIAKRGFSAEASKEIAARVIEANAIEKEKVEIGQLIALKAKELGTKAASLLANPYVLAGAAIAAIIASVVIWNRYQEKLIDQAHEIKEAYQSSQNELKQQADSIKTTASELAGLSKGVNVGLEGTTNISLTNEEYQRFLDLSNDLAKEFPELVRGWDEQGNAILNYNNLLEHTIELQEKKIQKDREDFVNSRNAYKDKGYKKYIIGYQTEMAKYTDLRISQDLESALPKIDFYGDNVAYTTQELYEKILKNRDRILGLFSEEKDKIKIEAELDEIQVKRDAIDNLSGDIADALTEQLQVDVGTRSQYKQLMGGFTDDLQAGLAKIGSSPYKTLEQMETESASLLNSFVKIQDNIPTSEVESLSQSLADGKISQEEYNAEMQKIIASVLALANGDQNLLAVLTNITNGWWDYSEQLNSTNEATEAQYSKVSEMADALKEAAQAIDTVKSAQEEYNETGYLSIDTLNNLLKLDDAHLASLIDENGQLALNTAGSYALMEAQLAEAEATAQSALAKAVAVDAAAQATEAFAILGNEALSDAQKISALNAALAGGIIDTTGWGEGTKAALASYQLVEDTINKLRSGKGSYKAPKSSSSKSSGSSKDTWLEAYKEELAELDHLKKMDKISTKEYYNELERLTHKYFTGRDKYHKEERENLEKLWDLYKQILDEEKERYETTLKYVDDVIDKKIEALEKEKEALEKKNKAQEDEIKLEQLQENLRKAKQRTMRVYYEDVGKMSADNKGDYIG